MKTQFRNLAKASLLASCIFSTLLLSSDAFARNEKVKIFPIGAVPYGKTYGEWSAEWWKWAFSLPVDQNPFFDEGGCEHGANGQSGPVWFLTGVINVSGSASRQCTVPADKAVFFPILNVECSVVEGNGSTEAELRGCTDFYMNTVTDVFLEIDGVHVANMDQYLAVSPLFNFGPLPDNNVLQLFGANAPPGTVSAAVNQGYHILLKPLPRGVHTLHYGGTFGDPINFTLDITYHLTVE